MSGFGDPNSHNVGAADLLSVLARVVSIQALSDRLSAATMCAQQQRQCSAIRATSQNIQDLSHVFRELHAARHDLTNLALRLCYRLRR